MNTDHDTGSRVTTDIGPFAIVPTWILERDLDGKALRVYIALRSWAGRGDECFPSRDSIAERAGVSVASYKRAMVDLEESGVVTRVPRYRNDGGIAGWIFHLPTLPPEPGGAHLLSRGGLNSRAGGGSPVEPAKEDFESNPPHEPTTGTDQTQDADASSSSETASRRPDNDSPSASGDSDQPGRGHEKRRAQRRQEDEPTRMDVETMCRRLRDKIVENGSKPPTITAGWRTAARLMLDKDGRELDKALNLIDWCQDNEFWRSNILSMPKFREQYDQLRLKAREEWERTRNGSGRGGDNRSNGHQPFRNRDDESVFLQGIQ